MKLQPAGTAKWAVICTDEELVPALRALSANGLHVDATVASTPSRRRVSDGRLAAALRQFNEGGIEAVMVAQGVGTRQAWRLIARARLQDNDPAGS